MFQGEPNLNIAGAILHMDLTHDLTFVIHNCNKILSL
jgi:hypothetical protein